MKVFRLRSGYRAASFILSACLALFVVAGCGIKGAPLPAGRLLPDRPSPPIFDFTEDGRLLVTFRPPDKDVERRPLKDLGGFFVDRSENQLRPGFCPTCPVEYNERLNIEAVRPPRRLAVADVPYTFEDTLKPGYVYHYRIYAHDSSENYDPSKFTTLMVYYDSPIRPPTGLAISTEDQLVFLKWTPPNHLVDGRPIEGLAGYDLYRRSEKEDWTKLNVAAPVPRPSFEDTQVDNNQNYVYKVRSVRKFQDTFIAGPASQPVSASPVDLTPPPPPVNLYGASVKEGVKLTWPEVEAADLAGYRVYRRTEGGAGFEPIGPPVLRGNLFLDETVKPGATYYYRVTSVDVSAAANESKPTQEIRVRFEP